MEKEKASEESEDKEVVYCFKDVLDNCKKRESSLLVQLTTVIKASRRQKDKLKMKTEEIAHQDCSLEYTSSDHIMRHKRKNADSHQGSSKRTRNSCTPFDFREQCFFCGDTCHVEPDPKNPERWKKNKGMLCRTADRGAGPKNVKEVLLKHVKFLY